MDEIEEIINRYNRRKYLPTDRYNILSPAIYMTEQDKERTFIKWIRYSGILPLKNKKLLEVGCGSGWNLLEFLRLGFQPGNLIGNDLIDNRVEQARNRLPPDLKIIAGNALDLKLENESFDIVFQSTVFSSILDENLQKDLAKKMWDFLKPGGGILWYDFIYNNPHNKDVIGIPSKKVKELFPYGKLKKWRTTLAPPLSRIVTKIHPAFYALFNFFPFLRTHILCWIIKPSDN